MHYIIRLHVCMDTLSSSDLASSAKEGLLYRASYGLRVATKPWFPPEVAFLAESSAQRPHNHVRAPCESDKTSSGLFAPRPTTRAELQLKPPKAGLGPGCSTLLITITPRIVSCAVNHCLAERHCDSLRRLEDDWHARRAEGALQSMDEWFFQENARLGVSMLVPASNSVCTV